ncbi:AcrR family transcriptional regulator [Prauserella isguenensis]|uniref:AcrR family transcriptional regulator n=1 Tax=Prauserella isguenensis TaxID=1470180 RepID=A0A839S1A0_9PSEU|nr:TetR/AcrR family transcriptional regulator [Prauserella isguenensis]MBB3051385.1 AcrR family transcriptional regulator [Prauserella isguenensis]
MTDRARPPDGGTPRDPAPTATPGPGTGSLTAPRTSKTPRASKTPRTSKTERDPDGPRSREERSAGSRELILDAAVDCLVDSGYAGASTLAIQARAGVSRGRLLHHFPSRDGLLVAAVQHLAGRRLRETEIRVSDALSGHPDGPERVDRCIELLWATFHEQHFWAAVELWTAARTNEALANALRPAERQLRESIRAVTDRIWSSSVRDHPRYDELRELLFTSMRGAALPYSFETRNPAHDRHVAVWKSTARALLYGE